MNDRLANYFYYLVGICAITAYSLVIYQHAYNIPKWDDFPEILQFIDRWLSAETFTDKFKVLISQTNEHILLVNHLIILAQYYLISHLNFSWLIYIGNIFYIGSAISLCLFFKEHPDRKYIFAILMLTGVTFYPYESTLWAMTAISNQAVICFSVLAIYFATNKNSNFFYTIFFSTLAIFSQSNGLFLLPIIGAYLYYTKQNKYLTPWLLFTASLIFIYAFFFNPSSQSDQPSLSKFTNIPIQNYFLIIPIFLNCLTASPFTKADPVSITVTLITGAMVAALVIFQLQKKAYSNPIVLVLTFLLLSIFSVAVFRGIFLGPSAAFVSHYKMYGSYFFTLGFLLSPMILSRIQKNRVLRFGILAFSAIYFIWSFPANLPQQKIIDGDLYKSLQQWAEDGDFRRVRGFFVRGADSYLFTALKNKTYSPVVLLPNDKLIDNIDILSSCPVDVNQIQSVTEKLDILHKNPNAAVIKILSLFDTGTKVTVTLCSSPADLSYRFEFISEPKIDTEEETHFVTRELIAPGNYTVFVKNGADLYKLETPFHNKQATR